MKDLNKIVTESVASKRPTYVQEAVNQILGEDITAGTTVAVIDDPIYGMSGAKGRVRGDSDKSGGFCDVELENGTKMPMQKSLLVPV